MLMICPEGHRDCLCGHKYKHPKEDSCDKEKCSGSLPCIPYIPEQPTIKRKMFKFDTRFTTDTDIPEQPKKPTELEFSNWCDTCRKRVGCKGNVGKVMSCPEYEAEPTCPECGHPMSEHYSLGCKHTTQAFLGHDHCPCINIPADLQPAEHRYCNEGHTIPLEEDSELCKGACPDFYPKDGKCIHLSLEPEPLRPALLVLREQFEDACMYYGCNPEDALLDRLEVIAVAHDQQVRQAAVKKFAEKCIKEMPLWGEITDREIAEWLRAMAEGGR